MIYKVRCSAHVTILEEEVISISAKSPKEAIKMANEAFDEIMNEKYSWVDYDEVHIEECVKCQ